MISFLDYSIVVICGIAILIDLLRIIKLLFNPGFLRHKVFDFPTDKVRLVLLTFCAIAILLLTIMLKLEML